MLKNYFIVAIRNLRRYKAVSLINIASLTIGITGCIIIGLFVWDEKKFDIDIPGAENVYRLYEERTNNGNTTFLACTPPMFASFLEQHYPEVDTSMRILMSGDKFLMENGDKKAYEDKGMFVESSFFKIFPLQFIKGDPSNALTTHNSVVLTEELATRYFGKENPVGKTIRIDKQDYEVKGVLAKMPSHFHLNFNYLMSLSSANIARERMEKWTWTQFYTYIKLKPGANSSSLEEKFQAYVKKEIHPTLTRSGSSFLPFFQPLKSIHLQSSNFIYDNAIRGNETYVKALTIIAIFVLIIACFNFINLATARSFKRAKEIGVRKVVGADRQQLIIQFIGETILLALISVLIAAFAAYLVLPYLNTFTGKSIEFNLFTHPILTPGLLAAGIVIGILAGIYPALVLSGFQPVKVLKNMKHDANGSSSGWLRQGLVVIQFGISIFLIVSTLIVYKQTEFLNHKDLGFNNDQVVFFQVNSDVEKNLETLKSEIKRSPGVIAVTSGYGLPGDKFAGDAVGVGKEYKEQPANVFIGDENYIKTLGLRIIAGRDFSKEMPTDITDAFIINETAVREFGFGTPEKAIGQPISWDEWEPVDSLKPVKKGKVIGVIQDFHYKSLHEKITASVIQLYPQVALKVAVKLKTSGIKSSLAYINTVWNKLSPRYPIDYKFMDESYGAMYKNEEKLSGLLWIFTIMAFVVGCMGLLGLAAFNAEQKVKEIGIRKVLGASIFDIMQLLSGNFIKLILIASLIAFPVAWLTVNNWLKDFPYRITISWWIFAIAIIAALGIALLTISVQSIKAAVANPVKSLRAE